MTTEEIFSTLESVAIAAGDAQMTSGHARLAAAVVRKGKIVSIGINQNQSHPFQARFGRNSKSVFFHAETKAILLALRKISEDSLKKCDLYITRVKYLDSQKRIYTTGLSSPCSGCLRCVNQYGIRSIFYSLDGSPNNRKQYKLLAR